MKTRSLKSASAKTAYTTKIIHDVPGDRVAAVVAEQTQDPNFRTYTILPEDDGEFTLIFIFDA